MNKTQTLLKAVIDSYFQMLWIIDDVSVGWGLVVYGLENLNLKESTGLYECLNGKINIFAFGGLFKAKKDILDPLTQAINIVGFNILVHFWKKVHLIEEEGGDLNSAVIKVNSLISSLPQNSILMLSQTTVDDDNQMAGYAKKRLQRLAGHKSEHN